MIKDLIKQFLESNDKLSTIDFHEGHKDHHKLEPNGLIPSLSTVLN